MRVLQSIESVPELGTTVKIGELSCAGHRLSRHCHASSTRYPCVFPRRCV